MPDYKFDIFVSVKSDAIFGEWVDATFLPFFEAYIRNDIIKVCMRPSVGIFYYRESLAPGDPWPEELRDGIRSSRVAVALCSPEYFYSKWCRTEFWSFWKRAQTTNKKVLVPISIHDGESFPPEAKDIQSADFADYVIIGDGFKETRKYGTFQEELKKFSARVAQLVKDAPDYHDWPLVDDQMEQAPPVIAQQTIST
jgi:hypothetical protein